MNFLKLAVVAGLAFGGVAHAAPAQRPKVDATYLPYEKPGILVKLRGGQIIHIKCMGTGSPTVILTAGMDDWSAAWRKVQPEIAETTRVCAWDRPGYGFSSGTTQPQGVTNRIADLEEALKVAQIQGPYISVGHSLGGLGALLFKDRNPRSVVGMVLVDSSIPNQHSRLRQAAPAFVAFGEHDLAQEIARYDRCLAALRAGKLKVGSPDPDGCLDYPPDYPPELSRALAMRDTNPLRFTAARSLATHFDSDGAALVDPKRNYGDMPLIVLTADPVANVAKLPASVTPAAKKEMPAEQAEWGRAHDELAALSTRGVNRQVPDATHYIQYDRPQAVIDAVDEVVTAARSSGASAKPAGRTHLLGR